MLTRRRCPTCDAEVPKVLFVEGTDSHYVQVQTLPRLEDVTPEPRPDGKTVVRFVAEVGLGLCTPDGVIVPPSASKED